MELLGYRMKGLFPLAGADKTTFYSTGSAAYNDYPAMG
jgi:hypothetical protein